MKYEQSLNFAANDSKSVELGVCYDDVSNKKSYVVNVENYNDKSISSESYDMKADAVAAYEAVIF